MIDITRRVLMDRDITHIVRRARNCKPLNHIIKEERFHPLTLADALYQTTDLVVEDLWGIDGVLAASYQFRFPKLGILYHTRSHLFVSEVNFRPITKENNQI